MEKNGENSMTAEFRYMMHLAGCAALGSTQELPPEGLDWAQVLVFMVQPASLFMTIHWTKVI